MSDQSTAGKPAACDTAPAELSVFVSQGWRVEGPKTNSASSCSFHPPDSAFRADELGRCTRERAKNFGVVEDAQSCSCWRLMLESDETISNQQLQPVKAALRMAMATVAASRVGACILQHKGWCLAPLQTLENVMIQLKSYSKESEHWPEGGIQSPAAAALKAAVTGLEEPFQTCLEILIESIPSHATEIDAESVVFLIANLDSMYYVLLDHHLTAPWRTPSVPAPHQYFPAFVDLMQPEASAAVTSLMQQSGSEAATAFREAWGLSEGNTFEGEADPLRKVMWARWQEAAVLLFHRGLGTHGEMDDAALEDAGFREWVANREKAGAEESGAAEGVAQGLGAIPEDSVEEPGGACASASGHVAEIGDMSEQEFDAAMRAALGAVDGSDDDDKDPEQLAREALQQADDDGVMPPPPAHTALQVFRDSSRAWPCHLYAFAAPNERALAALAALAPVLEVGAGVGYWTHLLRERGVTVVATDELPTVQCSMDVVNQYHGRVPAWTNVEQADSTCSGDYPDHALFLCYPPPASSMAEEALAAYSGDTVALVGEWDGDTGAQPFSQALLLGWSLQEAIPLPNWSDTAHDLTVWRRRDMPMRPNDFQAAPWPACSSTGRTFGESFRDEGKGLRRCRYLRSLQYSNEQAWEEHRQTAVGCLGLSFIFFKRELSFDSGMDFEEVRLFEEQKQ